MHGHSYRGKVILHTGPGRRSFVTAIDLNDGKMLWETDEPQEGSDKNKKGKVMGSWSTPVIARVGDADQIILMQPLRVVAYEPQSGRIIWSCDGNRHAGGDQSAGLDGDRPDLLDLGRGAGEPLGQLAHVQLGGQVDKLTDPVE